MRGYVERLKGYLNGVKRLLKRCDPLKRLMKSYLNGVKKQRFYRYIHKTVLKYAKKAVNCGQTSDLWINEASDY